jgi:hypothetical protein
VSFRYETETVHYVVLVTEDGKRVRCPEFGEYEKKRQAHDAARELNREKTKAGF